MDPRAGVTLEQAQHLQAEFYAKARRTAAMTGKKLPEAPLPSLFARAKNLAGAAIRTAKAVLDGQPVEVSPEVYQARLDKCQRCPSQQYRESDKTCAECGCYVRIKAAGAAEFCRLGHWKAEALAGQDAGILMASTWAAHKEKLLDVLPPEGASVAALRQMQEGKGCRGCRLRQLQTEALQAFLAEAPVWSAELRLAVRQLFSAWKQVFDGRELRALDQLLGSVTKNIEPAKENEHGHVR